MTTDVVAAHVAWLKALHSDGTLLLCGPCEDGTAVIVLRCRDREHAEAIAGADPFAAARAYGDREIVTISVATPDNNFLLG
ncbi:YciI family protein [Neorhizobium huautlense]|nr:YciI family protein [Neorhizobium huautlense]